MDARKSTGSVFQALEVRSADCGGASGFDLGSNKV
jgi:hypothetical protein